MVKKIILATRNKHKLKEIKYLLNFKDIDILTLNDFDNIPEVEESGKSYYENAYLKASLINKLTNFPVLSDDSGLEVEFLGNRPGIYSKRYAGKNGTDKDRIMKLLNELEGVEFKNRRARFVCCAFFVYNKKIFNVIGFCDGFIAFEPKGKNGFGFDPVFYIPELGKTMAQLSFEKKNIISHRANAFKKIREIILKELYNDK